MKTIYKYEISLFHNNPCEMPKEAEILCIKMQQSRPCMWALVDNELEKETRFFKVFGTGHQVEDVGKYVDTFLIENDSLVFHVFEQKEAGE